VAGFGQETGNGTEYMAKQDTMGFGKFAAWLKGATPAQIETLKAVEQADLDVLQIYTSLDNGGEETVPSAAEINAGPPVGAHGADASEQIARHAMLAGQTGRSQDYIELDSRLRDLQKAMGALVNILTKKANEDEIAANKDEDEDVGKSMRKARIAVRKAESCDDDDYSENMEKAEAALKSVGETISKAEDDAEDDDDEKKAEKARADLTALKGKLKALKVAKATPAPVAVVTKSEDEEKEEAKKSQDAALAEFAASKGLTVADMLARISSPVATGAALPAFPPSFSKSAGASVSTFIKRADDLRKAGTIDDNELQRVESVIAQVGAMNANLLAETVVQRSITGLSNKLQQVFTPVAA
jgi:hypothetical protein